MIDQNHALRLCEIQKELQPAPANPGELRQKLESCQQLWSARHGDEAVLAHTEPIAEEFVEMPLVTRVAAMDDNDAGLWCGTVRRCAVDDGHAGQLSKTGRRERMAQ
jgi:hypothetical protein